MLAPRRLLGRPVAERAGLAGGDVADEGPETDREVGLGGPGTWPCIGRQRTRGPASGDAHRLPSVHGRTPADRLHRAESTPRFPVDPKPPAGAPNVVRHRPRRHRIRPAGCLRLRHRDAAHGLAGRGGAPFNRFHVTSLCSPTRASFFTGRNHHAVGMGFLADIPLAFPGYHAAACRRRRPRSPACCATPATRRWPSASGTSPRGGSARRPGRSTAGRSASASSATTASSRATPTTGRRTWCATTTTSTRPAGPRRATT